ncbi:MAG: cadherin repeat domain-containing protein [Planctomycetota bacterium]
MMTARERVLALVVCGMFALIAVFWVGNQVRRSFSRREGQKKQLEMQLEQKRLSMARARYTAEQMSTYEDMSLPSDLENAQSQYQNWLSELSSDFVGEEVKLTSKSKRPDGSMVITCNVNGRADLRQLSEWLYEFYAVDALHRIRQMPLKPVPDTRLLDITIVVDALVLPGADKNKDFGRHPKTEIASKPMEEVIDPIVQRNFFSPANKAPKMDSIGRQQVEVGKSLSVRVKARDNPLDKIVYDLVDAPEGVEFNPKSGSISWKPDSPGNYEIVVAAEDDGIPVRRSEQSFVVNVKNPPPPPPPVVATTESESEAEVKLKFDDAKYTYPIASVDVSGKRQVWLQVRTTGKVLKLTEGATVQVGSIEAKVGKIEVRSFELTAGDRTKTMRLDEPIANFAPES